MFELEKLCQGEVEGGKPHQSVLANLQANVQHRKHGATMPWKIEIQHADRNRHLSALLLDSPLKLIAQCGLALTADAVPHENAIVT